MDYSIGLYFFQSAVIVSASAIALQPLRPGTCHLVHQTADCKGFTFHIIIAYKQNHMQSYLPKCLALLYRHIANMHNCREPFHAGEPFVFCCALGIET